MKRPSEPQGEPPWQPGSALPAEMRPAPCLTLLRARYGDLTETERRVADLLLASPALVLQMTVSEVAQASGVSSATVTRLSVKLGYTGFPALKIALAVELLNPQVGALEMIHDADDDAVVTQKVLRFGVQNLLDTATLLDPQAIGRAAAAILAAGRVELYALGAPAIAITDIFRARLLVVGISSTVFTDTRQVAASASLLKPGDVAIGLSPSGKAEPVIEGLKLAQANGATTICITSVPQSPVTSVAQIQLLTAFREAWYWGNSAASHLTALAVIDTLYAATLLRKYRAQQSSSPVVRQDDLLD
jgi:DNA-binding MurR/RpiR family transcriptional regulator